MNSFPFAIDKSWTLFLDRDGVINKRFVGDYVKRVEDFEFLPGVKEAIAQLSKQFGKIIVVTNQQGIGKGLYTETDLKAIHDFMCREIEQAGGKIDGVYYAPELEKEPFDKTQLRKPGIGMALKAQKDFPEIEFEKSLMIGDSRSDMVFAHHCGMKKIFLSEAPFTGRDEKLMDACVSSLAEAAKLISEP